MMSRTFTIGVVSILSGLATVVSAGEIVIRDCNGNTRAVRQVEEGITQKVMLSLPTSSSSAATLTELNTGRVVEGKVAGDVATFENVSAGLWSACLSPESSINKISFKGDNTSNQVITAGLLGATAVGAAIAIPKANSGGGSEIDLSTDPIVTSGSVTSTAGSNTSAGNVSSAGDTGKKRCIAAARTRAEDDGCRVRETPNPISPFL